MKPNSTSAMLNTNQRSFVEHVYYLCKREAGQRAVCTLHQIFGRQNVNGTIARHEWLCSFLPEEIQTLIIKSSDFQTQVAWSCINHHYYNLTGPLIWSDLSIEPSLQLTTVDKCERLLCTERRNRGNPLNWLKCLYVRFGSHESVYNAAYSINRFLQSSPNIVSFTLNGLCHSETLRILGTIEKLRYLDLKAPDFNRGQPNTCYVSSYDECSLFHWKPKALEFNYIMSLDDLTTLRIHCMKNDETLQVAQLVKKLKLTVLEISASRWNEKDKDRTQSSSFSSLITTLMQASTTLEGFPTSLEKLMLRDVYCKTISVKDLRLSAMNGSEKLLDITIAFGDMIWTLSDWNQRETHSTGSRMGFKFAETWTIKKDEEREICLR